MITSAKNYTKNKKKQTERTLGQMVKAKVYRQNHTQTQTHTHSQKEKKGKNIYISLHPKSTSSIWDDSLSIQVFHRCRYIKLIVEIYSTAPEAAGRDFPFSSLFAQLPRFSFGFGPASACRSPEGVCSCSHRTGLKEQLLRGLWLTQAGGREGYGCRASLRRHRPA